MSVGCGQQLILALPGTLVEKASLSWQLTSSKRKSNYYESVGCYLIAQPHLVCLSTASVFLLVLFLLSMNQIFRKCSNPMLKQHATISLKGSPYAGTATIFSKDQKTLRCKETNSCR